MLLFGSPFVLLSCMRLLICSIKSCFDFHSTSNNCIASLQKPFNFLASVQNSCWSFFSILSGWRGNHISFKAFRSSVLHFEWGYIQVFVFKFNPFWHLIFCVGDKGKTCNQHNRTTKTKCSKEWKRWIQSHDSKCFLTFLRKEFNKFEVYQPIISNY